MQYIPSVGYCKNITFNNIKSYTLQNIILLLQLGVKVLINFFSKIRKKIKSKYLKMSITQKLNVVDS